MQNVQTGDEMQNMQNERDAELERRANSEQPSILIIVTIL